MEIICYIGGTRLCPADRAFCEIFSYANTCLCVKGLFTYEKLYLLECVNKYTSLSAGLGGT